MSQEPYRLPREVAPLPPEIMMPAELRESGSSGDDDASVNAGGKTPGTLMKRLKKYAMAGALVLGGAAYTGSFLSGSTSSGESESRLESEQSEPEGEEETISGENP